MVGIDKAVVSRLVVSGQRFEILVDPDKALEFRKGGKADMSEILALPEVFRDVRNTDRIGNEELQKVFGTTDVFKIAERIVRQGDLQLTTEQKRVMVEQKKNQIANMISKRGINPQTNTPHPPQRILGVMDKAGINIDPLVEAELQVDMVVKKIKALIPISFQKVTIEMKIPPEYAGKAYSVLKSFGEMKNEKWLGDGSLQVNVQILAGMQDDVFQKISGLTHGNFTSKIVNRAEL